MIFLDQVIEEKALANPDAMAFVGIKSITYSELFQAICQLADLISNSIETTAPTIGLCFNDEIMEIAATLAVSRIGGRLISLPVAQPSVYRRKIASQIGVQLILTDVAVYDIDPSHTIKINWGELKKYSKNKKRLNVNENSSLIVVAGSGSTGSPKFFELNHSAIIERLNQRVSFFGIGKTDRFLRISSNSYIGSKIRVLAVLSAGGSVIVKDKRESNILNICIQYGVTLISAIVLQIEQLLQSKNKYLLDFGSKLRVLELSASYISNELRERIRSEFTQNIYITYSTNETGAISIASPSDLLLSPNTVGKVLPNVKIKIVGDHGNLNAGENGLIAVKTSQMISAYLGNSVLNKSFVDGYFITGDVGSIDANGQLLYTGRNDDLMIINGVSVYPAEIENVLKRHPDIENIKVKPIFHRIHQNIPVAVVSLKEGATSTDDDIYKLGVQLLGNKAPRKIIITNEFPMSGLGKVDHDKIMSIINRYKVITESFDKKSLPRINSNKRLAADLTVSLLQIRLENLSNKLLAISELSRWSPFLLPPVQSEYESDFGYCGFLDPIDEADRSFIEFLVRLTKVLLTEGKVPCFSDILIKSVKCENNDQSTFGIALQIPIVDNIPLIIYKSTFEFSAALCGWISENSPTSENKTKVFNKILEKVIKPLHKLIPAGKSTIPVLKVAHSLGIPFMHLGAGVYQLGWGSKARRLDRSSSELDSAMGAKLAQNKVVAANLLRLAGLPAPSHAVVKNESEALAAADRLGLPVVIKPTDRDRGEGVSVDVVNSEGIKQAFSHARELSKSKQVLVERQVSGVCHRLFIANGHLLYAVKRLPMSVRGDGRRTVAQLVDDEVAAQNNKAPWVRSEIQPIDERALKALASAGLSLQSIPKEGAWAPLRRIESTADGGIDEEVTTIIHPENLSAAIAAAKFFGLHVAGIDIISPDISKPWHENGAIINEVNFAPLFGGGEISRSHIPRFFADFIDGDGKIPIEAFDTEEAAIAKQAAYQRQGLRCYFTTSATTIDFSGKPLSMPFNDAKQRVKALICRSDVDAITVYLPRTKA